MARPGSAARGAALAICALVVGCFGGKGGDTGAGDGACGDLDGPGGDTGDIPDILGSWTTSFGRQSFFENCSITGLKQEDLGWIDGAVMRIKGQVPDNIAAEFDSEDSERFYGLENAAGGVVFTGSHEQDGYTMTVSFGGLLYTNAYQGDRARIDGFGFLGVDSLGDGAVDCWLQGEFTAIKSGS